MNVGKYDIPDMRLYPTLVNDTEKLFEKFKSEEADSLTAAKLLGHKTDKSGAFLRKLACLRAYGLIEKRGIKVTDVGKRLTWGESEQIRNHALKEAILNIPLWKQFHSKWEVKLPTSDFWVDLGKITGLEAPDAQKIEKNVRKAYLDDIQYLKPEKEPETGRLDMKPSDQIDQSAAIPPSVEHQANIVKGLIREGAYDIAKNFIDFIKEKKEKEPTPEEEG